MASGCFSRQRRNTENNPKTSAQRRNRTADTGIFNPSRRPGPDGLSGGKGTATVLNTDHRPGTKVRVTQGLSKGAEGKVLGVFGSFGANEPLYRVELGGIERVIRETYLEVVS